MKNPVKTMMSYASILTFCALFICSSCGYHMGSTMHPQIKTIAVAPVVNDTMEPFTSAIMRGALCEQFVVDSSLKVKSLESADCIVYTKILKVENTATSEDSYDQDMTYRAAEWALQVTVEFSVIIPGREKALVETRQISEAADYQVTADHAIARRHGLKQACRAVAERIVEYTTEAW